MGLSYTHAGVDIDETRRPGESPEVMVERLAREKAEAVASDLPVLGADTVVVLGDTVFGKPASLEDALAMLDALSGKTHRVMTAVALRFDGNTKVDMSNTEVRFRDIDPDEARAYWQSGEPAGKAGAYAVQGIGGVFVESIKGSYSGVVGLPVFETARLLESAGIKIPGAIDKP
jgi:septum formation protein